VAAGSARVGRGRVPVGERGGRHSRRGRPRAGPPLVDTLRDSNVSNLKELRPRSGRDVSIRVIFVFDPWSQAVLLVAGNKAGNWTHWYDENIPVAEGLYEQWLAAERKRREEQ
jgi:hypothetical protein